ncbi:MAG: permease prefix domain 1-containing protein [Candidatus Saccharibacteria bacterium]
MFDLEVNIRSWSDHLRTRGSLVETDIIELENHLRDQIEELMNSGLAPDEAFLISVKRLGNVNAISHEYSKVNSENLWKHLLLDSIDPITRAENRRNIALVVLFSLIAGTLAQIPKLFGISFNDPTTDSLYCRNLSLFILPLVALFFSIKHKVNWKMAATILSIFGLTAVVINMYPSLYPYNTGYLTGIHLLIFLWLLTGVAYLGAEWQVSRRRMDFIRLTGETFIYGVLVFAGVMVSIVFTMVIFKAIQIDISDFIGEYLIIYGACAAAMISVYLVEAKKSVVENFAPILAKIFSPLFLIIMAVFLAVMIISGKSPFIEREFLIAFDFMLIMVLGLVLYVISARGTHDQVNLFDYLNLALIILALIIDSVALSAILFRVSAFGVTPNKIAALGENLVLLVNLGGLAWLYGRYLMKKVEFGIIEKWQTFYLYVFAIWTAIVAFVFPVVFRFR